MIKWIKDKIKYFIGWLADKMNIYYLFLIVLILVYILGLVYIVATCGKAPKAQPIIYLPLMR